MRAKLVEYNFERGKDPKDQMKVGYGPAKPEYINDFLEAMNDMGIDPVLTQRKEFGNLMIWSLKLKPLSPALPPGIYGKSVFLIPPEPGISKMEKVGWNFEPIGDNDFFDTPYPIIKYIAEEVLGTDIDERIQALKDALEEEEAAREIMQKWSKKWS